MAYTDKMFKLGMVYSLIKTTYGCSSIPTKDFDWCAYLVGYEENSSCYGYGKTKQEAIGNLLENCKEIFNI